MRVTEGLRYSQVLGQLSQLNQAHAKAGNRAMTGRRLEVPSDDPIAAAELARNQAATDSIDSYKDTIKAVTGDTELAEAALAQANEIFVRVKEIATQASNGSLSGQDRQNLATEVRHLKDELVSIANTKGTRGYIFSGSKVDTSPFDSAGVFSGDDAAHVVDLGSGSPADVSVSGANAFTVSGGRNVFADLDALNTALTTNDEPGVRATLGNLEASRVQISNVRSQSGLLIRRLESSNQVFEDVGIEYQRRNQQIGAADQAEAYAALTAFTNALERSVAVSRQILNTDFLQRFG